MIDVTLVPNSAVRVPLKVPPRMSPQKVRAAFINYLKQSQGNYDRFLKGLAGKEGDIAFWVNTSFWDIFQFRLFVRNDLKGYRRVHTIFDINGGVILTGIGRSLRYSFLSIRNLILRPASPVGEISFCTYCWGILSLSWLRFDALSWDIKLLLISSWILISVFLFIGVAISKQFLKSQEIEPSTKTGILVVREILLATTNFFSFLKTFILFVLVAFVLKSLSEIPFFL